MYTAIIKSGQVEVQVVFHLPGLEEYQRPEYSGDSTLIQTVKRAIAISRDREGHIVVPEECSPRKFYDAIVAMNLDRPSFNTSFPGDNWLEARQPLAQLDPGQKS